MAMELGGEALDKALFNARRLSWIASYLADARKIDRTVPGSWRISPGRIDSDRLPVLSSAGWKTIRLNETWGGNREDLLWRTQIRLDRSRKGHAVAIGLDIGAEALVFVNGNAVKGLTPFHPEVLLTACARGNETFDIVLEAHSGWSHPRWSSPHGCAGGYHVFRTAELYTVHPVLDELMFTVSALNGMGTSGLKDPEVLSRAVLVLKDLPMGVRPVGEFLELVPEILKKLRRLNSRPRRSSGWVGHSHLDVAYLWPLREGIRKNARTMLTACDMIERDSDFTFACSQAFLFREMKIKYPSVFWRMKRAVRTGRFLPVGGMWVESDLNCTSGESVVRQILYGQEFFNTEFGVHSRVAWLPDVFGYGAALPQLLRQAGMDCFCTAKLSFGYPPTFPHSAFRWIGLDGSEVRGLVLPLYGGAADFGRLEAANAKADEKMYPATAALPIAYGYSDGGQGVTPEMRGNIRAMKALYGRKIIRDTTVDDWFGQLSGLRLPEWKGELSLNCHQGTFTTSAENKRLNRRTEELLSMLDMLAAFGGARESSRVRDLWREALVLQFHDILPGSCVKEVYEDSMQSYTRIHEKGKRLLDVLTRKLIGSGAGANTGLLNPLGFTRRDYAVVEATGGSFTNLSGQTLDAQRIGRGKYLVDAGPVEGFSARIVSASGKRSSGKRGKSVFSNVSKKGIVTPFYRVRFEKGGVISSIVSTGSGRQVLRHPSNVFHLFVDENTHYSAWDIVHDFEARKQDLTAFDKWEVLDAGTLCVAYRSRRSFGNSVICQTIRFYRDMPRIDFETEVDWQEDARMLKVAFFPRVNTKHARYETQFGFIKRPLDSKSRKDGGGPEMPHFRWADVSERKFGVALMNDSKYGIDAHPGMLRLTLLRSPMFPNPEVDRGRHSFTYSLLPHDAGFAGSGVVRSAMELNCPLVVRPGACREFTAPVSIERGVFAIDTMKRAERGGGIVVRVYEPYGRRASRCRIGLSLPGSVVECDLLEHCSRRVERSDDGIDFSLAPFQVRTFLIGDDCIST